MLARQSNDDASTNWPPTYGHRATTSVHGACAAQVAIPRRPAGKRRDGRGRRNQHREQWPVDKWCETMNRHGQAGVAAQGVHRVCPLLARTLAAINQQGGKTFLAAAAAAGGFSRHRQAVTLALLLYYLGLGMHVWINGDRQRPSSLDILAMRQACTARRVLLMTRAQAGPVPLYKQPQHRATSSLYVDGGRGVRTRSAHIARSTIVSTTACEKSRDG